MSYIAKRFQGKAAGLSLDTDALSKYNDIIDLSIGDTDFITDERIISAAFEDAKRGYTRYGFPKGDPELIHAIQTAWMEDFGQQVSEHEVIVTASSCMGMSLALLAILDPGDEVIVFSPYFGVYKQQIELAGGVCVEIACREEDDWAINEEQMRNAISDRTKAVIFNNPSNPTGCAYSIRDMELLATLAKEHDFLILADEIYTRYLFEGEFVPMRTLPDMADRTITLNSFSKNFMMTGWRVGYIIAQPDIIAAISMINGGMIYTTPSVSQRAAIKALELRQTVQDLYISQYKKRVLYAAQRIHQIPYFTLSDPKGTFYLFPGIGKTGLSAPEFCKLALDRAHVIVVPGEAFGQAGKNHIRIACTTSDDKIREAFDRLADIFE